MGDDEQDEKDTRSQAGQLVAAGAVLGVGVGAAIGVGAAFAWNALRG